MMYMTLFPPNRPHHREKFNNSSTRFQTAALEKTYQGKSRQHNGISALSTNLLKTLKKCLGTLYLKICARVP